MGRKYGSLHVKTGIKEDAIIMVQQTYEYKVRNRLWLQENYNIDSLIQNKPTLKDSFAMISKMFETIQKMSVPMIKNHGEIVSVYDEYLNYENIEYAATHLNRLLGCTVLFSSVFDDDVFLFGVAEKGTIISRFAGDGGEEYGVMPKRTNLDGLFMFAGIKDIEGFGTMQIENQEFEQLLSDTLGFDLSGQGEE